MNVKNIEHITLSNAWANLKRIDFDFKFKNGQWKRLSRETYNRGNGAAILLYNRQEQTVILTKQFRMPIYENSKEESFSIEVCAGAIDNNDSALETILREVREETGYSIHTAKQILSTYTSPGALTEKMYLFIASYDHTNKVNVGGGLLEENEELEVLELPFEQAVEMVDSGKIRDAKTILLLQYAQINRVMQLS